MDIGMRALDQERVPVAGERGTVRGLQGGMRENGEQDRGNGENGVRGTCQPGGHSALKLGLDGPVGALTNSLADTLDQHKSVCTPDLGQVTSWADPQQGRCKDALGLNKPDGDLISCTTELPGVCSLTRPIVVSHNHNCRTRDTPSIA